MLSRTARTFLGTLAAIILAFAVDGVIIYYVNLPQPVDPASFPIQTKHATTIAQDKAPNATVIGEPTLVTYGETYAYEVPLDRGLIYIEASTGRVLANTTRDPSLATQ